MTGDVSRPRSYRPARWLAPAAGFALVHAVFVLPERPWQVSPESLLRPPLEALVVAVVLAAAPAWARPPLRLTVVALVGILLVLKAGDMAGFAVTGRAFDPLTDWRTFGPAWTFAAGSWGAGAVAAVALAGTGLVAVLLVALDRALARFCVLVAPARPGFVRPAAAAVAALAAGAAFVASDPVPGARFLVGHVALSVDNVRDLSDLVASAETDPVGGLAAERLFGRISGKDIIVAFVESYGRSALEHRRYAPALRSRLAAFEAVVDERGLAARSGWLTAPVVGGRSWLAHASLLSGLWIDRQQRYDWLVASERESLNAMFARAGWRSVAVMPAITLDWPEAAYYGYDAVYAADDLGYRGKPFNWVTMPDQFTLAALRRLELAAPDRPPVMAEVALISSHAPWTPIPPVLPWEAIGDGRAFDVHAEAGDPPSVVWRDRDRVREQYRKAVDYALATLAAYVEEYGDPDTILIVLGDHQPAAIVTGPGALRDVPVHVVAAAGSPLLEAAAAWGWRAGMTPGEEPARWRMDEFRAPFVRALSTPAD